MPFWCIIHTDKADSIKRIDFAKVKFTEKNNKILRRKFTEILHNNFLFYVYPIAKLF